MKRSLILAAAAVTLGAAGVLAQDPIWELRLVAGTAIPTGAHRTAFSGAALVGSQLGLRLTPTVDLVGSFDWQPSDAKYPVDPRRASVLVYNVGLERGFRREHAASPSFVPFAGAGVGGRAYDFRGSSLVSSACYAGYASGGIAYERPRSTLRLEARDNLFCFKTPVKPYAQTTRNEVSLLAGAGIRF
jgi:hypothetical protein